MWFVLLVAVIVIAGWVVLATSDRVTRRGETWVDENPPGNSYDNPAAPDDVNDRPFAPDAADDRDCGNDRND